MFVRLARIISISFIQRRERGRVKVAGQSTGKTKSAQSDTPENGALDASAPIGDQLKAMFDTVATSPMPEHLAQLVDELEEKYRAGELRPDPKN
nr:NepR family anti-sigma factor [Caulobacter sp. 17J65-9]